MHINFKVCLKLNCLLIDTIIIIDTLLHRDHRTVYVGDARGRVFTWNVAEQPGKGVADHWLKDEGAEQCNLCDVRFSLYERRHHCRNCGQLFCSK